MKAAITIVRRDLTRYLRAPVRTALMFAMPLLLAGVAQDGFQSGDIIVNVGEYDVTHRSRVALILD